MTTSTVTTWATPFLILVAAKGRAAIIREKLAILDRIPQLTGREALNIVLEGFDELDKHLENQKSKRERNEKSNSETGFGTAAMDEGPA